MLILPLTSTSKLPILFYFEENNQCLKVLVLSCSQHIKMSLYVTFQIWVRFKICRVIQISTFNPNFNSWVVIEPMKTVEHEHKCRFQPYQILVRQQTKHTSTIATSSNFGIFRSSLSLKILPKFDKDIKIYQNFKY